MVKGSFVQGTKPTTLGARIRAIRKAWGWTQDDLARAVGNDRQIISYWERDKAKPTRSAMAILSRVLRLPAEALASGEGFTIPDCVSSQADQLVSAFRDAVLPHASRPGFSAVDLTDGSIKPMTLSEAKRFLQQSHESEMAVWIVSTEIPESDR